MLFTFLRFVKPIWYLNLRPFPPELLVDYRSLSTEEKKLIDYCTDYSTSEGALMDAAMQAWFKGFIESNPHRCLTIASACARPEDNYLFLRRFFSPFWSWYALFVRLSTLNNPVRELRSFIKHFRVSRVSLFDETMQYPGLADEASPREEYFVSVIIPTLNRYEYLQDALRDLERQDFPNFEVIIVDQSEPYDESFYTQFRLELKAFRQNEKALWKARNTAVKASRGNLILMFDDDSRVEPDWITRHVECLGYFHADLSSGVSLSRVGGTIPKTYAYYKWSDQVDTGNVMIRKSAFQQVGLFDRQFERQRMGDAEFGLRCYLRGLRNVSNPEAFRVHLKIGTGGLREMGSWDAFRPGGLLSPRPVPSVLYYFRKYYGGRAAIFAMIRALPLSIIPYRLKSNKMLTVLGSVAGLFLVPLIVFQVTLSWRQSSQKLKQGDRIEYL